MTLRVTIKKQWFDLILSGEKKEEYREIKPYWTERLQSANFSRIEFINGYRDKSPRATYEMKGYSEKIGKRKWGAPKGQKVYSIKLGNLISRKFI